MALERLGGLAASFLYLETPTQHMHVVATMLLEPEAPAEPPGGAGAPGGAAAAPLAERVRETLVRRLLAQDAFRRRIVEAPLGIVHPFWVEAAMLDPAAHVRAVTLPAPGGAGQLAAEVARIASSALDRRRPLWELWTIAGVEGGRVGVVLKVHHAILDGVAGLGVLMRLLTPAPDAEAGDRAGMAVAAVEEPATLELAASAMQSLARTPLALARTLGRTAIALPALARSLRERLPAAAGAGMPFPAPRTSLNRALTAERAVAFGRVELATVKEIKNAFGVTVNDVVLAACARALGEHLRAHGARPDQPVVASVPVSEHDAEDLARPRNRVSAMLVTLPVHLDDVAAIVAWVQAHAARAKRVYRSLGPEMLAAWAEVAPPRPLAGAVQLYSRWRLAEWVPPPHSVVISNVPGPPFSLFLEGARLVAAYPLGPVLEGAGVNVTVLSYAGNVDVGVITCPRAVPEPAEIARGFERAIDELRAAAVRRTDGNARSRAAPDEPPG